MFLGMLLNSIFRATPQNAQLFPGKTYHAPALLAGVAAAPSTSAQANALLDGLTPLAPPDAHGEVADYSDSAGHIYYTLAVVQDNLGHSVMRFDSDLANQFPAVDSQTQVSKTSNGISYSCGTMPESSGSYQGCTWYNSFAFGAYIDNVSTTPSQAMATLQPALQYMTNPLATGRRANIS
jgi:hypothetical protein